MFVYLKVNNETTSIFTDYYKKKGRKINTKWYVMSKLL